jgi:hypothetical protein
MEEAKPIFVPTWREMTQEEQNVLPSDESSASEDTTDNFYKEAHDKANQQLKEMIQEYVPFIFILILLGLSDWWPRGEKTHRI